MFSPSPEACPRNGGVGMPPLQENLGTPPCPVIQHEQGKHELERQARRNGAQVDAAAVAAPLTLDLGPPLAVHLKLET
jgi:hypothetical protein